MKVHFGLLFPETNLSYSLELQWGEYNLLFHSSFSSKGIWKFFIRKEMTCDFPYSTPDELPDVFIYLVQDDKKKIAFIRKKAAFFLQKFEQDANYYFFKKDEAIKSSKQFLLFLKIQCFFFFNFFLLNFCELFIAGQNLK